MSWCVMITERVLILQASNKQTAMPTNFVRSHVEQKSYNNFTLLIPVFLGLSLSTYPDMRSLATHDTRPQPRPPPRLPNPSSPTNAQTPQSRPSLSPSLPQRSRSVPSAYAGFSHFSVGIGSMQPGHEGLRSRGPHTPCGVWLTVRVV
jgi:hypothetical protein